MSNNTYWNSNGKHELAYKELSKLVPLSGPAGTVEGEMLRASTRVYYDFYNNGFLNNTSGAVNYLLRCDALFDLGIHKELLIIKSECNTGDYTDQSLSDSLEIIANAVIEYLISKDRLFTESNDNLFDYADPDNDNYMWEDDEDEFNEIEFEN